MLGVAPHIWHPMQGMRPKLWASLVSILSKLGTLQMEQLRNQALVILQRYPSHCPSTGSGLPDDSYNSACVPNDHHCCCFLSQSYALV